MWISVSNKKTETHEQNATHHSSDLGHLKCTPPPKQGIWEEAPLILFTTTLVFLNWNSLENTGVCMCMTQLFHVQNNEHNFLVLSSNIAKFLEVVGTQFLKSSI